MRIDPVRDYANKVLDGKIIAGPSVRAAAARHLKDLDCGSSRGLRFDLDAAEHVFGFFEECLRLRDGQFDGQPFRLAPSQKFVLGNLFGWKNDDGTRRFRQCYDEEAKGNGKALALDTPIPTPAGWTIMGDIRVGDVVFGADGKPTLVTGAHDIMFNHECFEVEFDDGEVIVADADHLWFTEMRRKVSGSGALGTASAQKGVAIKDRGAWRKAVRSTKQIADTLRYKNGSIASANHSVPLAQALQLPDAALPIDPYILGVWLGDGDSDCARISCADKDADLIDIIRASGCAVGDRRAMKGEVGRYRIFGLNALLRKNGLLKNKHIPQCYLRGSVGQRASLVQGLMDTDGHIDARSGQCEFTNTNRQIASAFCEILISMGIKCRVIEGDATIAGSFVSKKYRVLFFPPVTTAVFRLPRKKQLQIARTRRRRLSQDRRIVDCRPCVSVPVRCIRVASADSLFLAGRSMVPTHNTPLAAGVGLLLLCADNEASAEIYFGGPTKDQAFIGFNDAVGFVDRNEDLAEKIRKKGENPVEGLSYPEMSGVLVPISADATKKSGYRPSGVVIDEVHELGKNEGLIDMLRAGFKFRRNPLLFMITNSGYDRLTVCWKLHEKGQKVAAGVEDDDAFFAFICELDKGDDPLKDEKCWPKANPLLGITTTKVYLRNEMKQMRSNGKINLCLRLNFCQWTSAESAWLPPEVWSRVLYDHTPADIERLRHLPCWGALDLSRVRDLTALTLMFLNEDQTLDALSWFWTPAEGIAERSETDGAPYEDWANPDWEDQAGEDPFLIATPGPEVDYGYVSEKLKTLNGIFDIKGVTFDPYEIVRMRRALDDVSCEVPLFEHTQGARMTRQTGLWMPGSINLLESSIYQGKIRIQRSPVMTMCAMSAVCHPIDPMGNRIFSKQKATRRIDGAVTLAMARGALEKKLGKVKRRSIYEQIAEQRKAEESADAPQSA